MILSRSSSDSFDKEISNPMEWGGERAGGPPQRGRNLLMCRPLPAAWLQHIRILADDSLAQDQTEMQTCSARRQNKVADRSSHMCNRCGTAVATVASVEILAKGNHHAFPLQIFHQICVNFGLFGNNLPNASYLWASHPSHKTTHSKAAPAASAWITRFWCCTGNAFQHPPSQSRGGGGPSDVNVILVSWAP